MHASIEQLIGLRDGEPATTDLQDHVRGCEACARVLNDLAALSARVRNLPDPVVPTGAWSGILDQVDRPVASTRLRWLPAAGVALVASIAAAVILVGMPSRPPVGDSTTVAATFAPPASLDDLMAQSRYLERAVLSLNDSADRMVVSAGTASTIAALEDRIALVDYEINHAPAKSRSDRDLEKLWQQRVSLLQSLAAVRYAQVASNSI